MWLSFGVNGVGGDGFIVSPTVASPGLPPRPIRLKEQVRFAETHI
jgi:hypothetical protein